MERKTRLALIFICSLQLVLAQTTTFDGGYTPGVAPGAPAGSYALSGFESVNLFNGNLNFSLPLLEVGGRGEAKYTIPLTLENQWTVRATARTEQSPPFLFQTEEDLTIFKVFYEPGILTERKGFELVSCGNDIYVQNKALTRFFFTLPDRTVMEFRDKSTDGWPLENTCSNGATVERPRGREFVTTDGSAATLILDAPFTEAANYNSSTETGEERSGPGSFLFFRDGRVYRIDGGRVQWIRDRNGNMIQFSAFDSEGRPSQIQDSLGRTITITYDISENGGTYDRIGFKGYNNADRFIYVHRKNLSSVLAPGFTAIKTYDELFPKGDLNGHIPPGDVEDHDTLFNPSVVASVDLPNSKSYTFRYSPYAELYEVTLPTGGKIKYTFDKGDGPNTRNSGVASIDPAMGLKQIHRRVKTRSLSDAAGTVLESQTFDTTIHTDRKVKVTHLDGKQETHEFYGVPTGLPPPWTYSSWQRGKEREVVEDSRRTTTHMWEQRTCVSWFAPTCGNKNDPAAPPKDPRIQSTTTTVADSTPGVTLTETYTYDQFNNRESITASGPNASKVTTSTYDTSYQNPPADAFSAPSNPPNVSRGHLRSLPKSITTGATVTEFFYDTQMDGAKCPETATGLVTRTTPTQHDSAFGTGFTQRGNVRCEVRQKSTGSYLITEHEYDILGNVVKTKLPENRVDSNGHIVEFEYTGSTFAFATKIKRKVNANKTLETSVAWDYAIAKPTSITAPNGQSTTYAYDDALDRLKTITPPTAAGSSTSFAYDDTSLTVTSSQAQDSCAASNNTIERRTAYDSLGRMKATAVKEPGGNWITTNQGYDSRGRQNRVSHPHLTSDGGSETGALWTTTTIDALGRVTRVETPDGAATTYAIDNDKTLVTDPASKTQCVVRDGFGRIYEIWEATSSCATRPTDTKLITTYGYDQLDRLTSVAQVPLSNRIFGYDNAGRLTSASNPEKNVTYDYDNNGNLRTKTSGNGSISYTYDGVGRIRTKSFAGYLATFCYDGNNTAADGCLGGPSGNNNLNGHLTMVSSTPSVTKYTAYDDLGRVTASQQTISDVTFPFGYAYNRAGGLEVMTFPSGRQTRTCYDQAARVTAVRKGTDTQNPASYVTVNSYEPHGAPRQLTLGNNVVETWSYDVNRLQVTQVKATRGADLMQLDFCYTGTNPAACPENSTSNNGDLLGQRVTRPGSALSNSYGYDAYSRISSWTMTGGQQTRTQTYCLDARGNRALVANSWVPPGEVMTSPTVSDCTATAMTALYPANNRWTGNQVSYDAAGNQTASGAGMTLTYNVEDRIATSQLGNQTTTYLYDGEGHRVAKFTLLGTDSIVDNHVYVYDAFGRRVARYTLVGGDTGVSGPRYMTTDHLGNIRLETDSQGMLMRAMDFTPYGSELPGQTGGEVLKFTGKERDAETGLDYFGARYMSAAQGRFTSPDPLFFQKEMLVDPQRWNLYAYVRNNPLRLVDPTGERIELTGETEEERKRQLAAIQQAVGKEAGARLAIQEDKKTGQFFVGITGDVSTFRDINPAASTFATIISLDEVAKFHVVASKERMDMGDGKEYTLSGLGAGGATARDSNGQLHVFVQRPEEGYGSSWSGMSGWWPLSNNLGTVTGHEFGHALEHMFYGLMGQSPSKEQSNRGALVLENKVRRLQRGPDAATRLKH